MCIWRFLQFKSSSGRRLAYRFRSRALLQEPGQWLYIAAWTCGASKSSLFWHWPAISVGALQPAAAKTWHGCFWAFCSFDLKQGISITCAVWGATALFWWLGDAHVIALFSPVWLSHKENDWALISLMPIRCNRLRHESVTLRALKKKSYLGKIPMLTHIFQMGWNLLLSRSDDEKSEAQIQLEVARERSRY